MASFNFLALHPPQVPASSQAFNPVVEERFNQVDELRSQDESVFSGVVNGAFFFGLLRV